MSDQDNKDFWHPAVNLAPSEHEVKKVKPSTSIVEAIEKAVDDFAAKEEPDVPCSLYESYGRDIGKLIASKQVQYGDSAGRTGKILEILYPDGVPSYAYDDQQFITRCLDKFSRIAQRREDGQDLGGESPWKDIAGYAILAWIKDERNT